MAEQIEKTEEVAGREASGVDAVVSFDEFPATIKQVKYRRQTPAAHRVAYHEHERLMADGWEFLGKPLLTENYCINYYVKRN